MTGALDAERARFERHGGRSVSMPIAGALVWAAVGLASVVLDDRQATFALLVGTGLTFPVALAIARLLDERLVDNPSPLAGLMGRSVLMVNLLWAVHVSLALHDWAYLPLTLGVGLGLHWVVFGWIVAHPVGTVHAVLRTLLVTVAWWAFPDARVGAVALAVVVAYAYAIVVLLRRPRS